MEIEKKMSKFFSPAEKAIIGKDFGELWKFGGYRSLLIGFTLVLAVMLPIMYLVAIIAMPNDQLAISSNIGKFIPAEYPNFTYSQGLYYILINLVCPMFFILIPIFTAMATSALFFVGEKETGTMSSLVGTSCTPKHIFRAKFFCSVINALVVSFVAFIAIFIIASVGSAYFRIPFFFNLLWTVLVFILSPALSVLGVLIIYFTLNKYNRILDSIMTCGYLILPFIVLFIGQFAGLYEISWVLLFVVAIAIIVFDVVCYNIATVKITAEKLI